MAVFFSGSGDNSPARDSKVLIENDAGSHNVTDTPGSSDNKSSSGALFSPRPQQHDAAEEGVVRFNPPVYKQRYRAVYEIAKKFAVSSVVDIGCAECKLILMLKSPALKLSRLTGVDIDEHLLDAYSNTAKPLTYEFMCRPRASPFTLTLLSGDIGTRDERLAGFDMVSAVEIIEHLLPHTLLQFPLTIFGFMRPRIAIITTPNEDFNHILGLSPGQFRHPDHKFEWTRAQFRDWCVTQCKSYGYDVEFSFIGYLDSEPDHEKFGGCSQMAVFTRIDDANIQAPSMNSDGRVYKTIAEVNYPYETRSLAVRLRGEVQYTMTQLSREAQQHADCYFSTVQLPIKLADLIQYQMINDLVSGDLSLLIETLQDPECGFEIRDLDSDDPFIMHIVRPYERSSDDQSDESSPSEQRQVTSPDHVQIQW